MMHGVRSRGVDLVVEAQGLNNSSEALRVARTFGIPRADQDHAGWVSGEDLMRPIEECLECLFKGGLSC